MSHTTTAATAAAPRRSAAQWAIVAVLVILGILALVAAILFMTGAANSIHFLSGSVHHGHHQVRLTVSLVAAVLLLAAAGYFIKTTSKSLCRGSAVETSCGPKDPSAETRARTGGCTRLVNSSHVVLVVRCGAVAFPFPGPGNRETSRVAA